VSHQLQYITSSSFGFVGQVHSCLLSRAPLVVIRMRSTLYSFNNVHNVPRPLLTRPPRTPQRQPIVRPMDLKAQVHGLRNNRRKQDDVGQSRPGCQPLAKVIHRVSNANVGAP